MEGTTNDDWLEQCFEASKKTEDMRDDKYASAFFDSSKQIEEIRDEKYSQTFSDSDSFTPVVLKRSKASRPHSTPLTLKWLEENYEIAEGVCIPRSTLYMHYLDYCEKNDTQPVNAASFGKIIRQQFSHITTRRLGTRGQSKYHYYGIGVRESSIYYDIVYSAKSVQSFGDGKKEAVKQIVAYSPRSKLGTLLPDFPDVKDIKLPPNVEEGKVVTFLMMYRAHCQRILDTVIRANFDEVQNFLLHFWQGMPQHIVPILESQTIATVVGVCDSVLYKAISGVLMPTVLQPLPDSLTHVIRRFAKQLDEWLRVALQGLPNKLIQIKFDLARRFAQVLRRQTSLNHLCVAARSVIHNGEITSQMLDDWMNIDLSSIVKQTLYTMDQYSEKDHFILVSLCKELEQLFEEQASIESYTAWLDSMVDRCVASPSSKRPGSLRRLARQFLLMWSCFGTRVIRDMTLYSAPSFGSFHLLHLMFDEYVLYLVESLHSQERTREFLASIKGEECVDQSEDIILPNPIFTKESFDTKEGSSLVYSNTAPLCVERSTVITNGRDAPLTVSNFPTLCPSRLDDVYSNDSSPRSSVSSYSPGRSPTGSGHELTLEQTASIPTDHRTGQTSQSSCDQRFDNYGYNNYYNGGTMAPQDCQASYMYNFGNTSYTSGRQEISDSNLEWANEMARYNNSTPGNRSRTDATSTTSSCMSPGVPGGVDYSYGSYDYSGYTGQHYTAPAQNGIPNNYQAYAQTECQVGNMRETGKRKLPMDASQIGSTLSCKRQKPHDAFNYVPVTYT